MVGEVGRDGPRLAPAGRGTGQTSSGSHKAAGAGSAWVKTGCGEMADRGSAGQRAAPQWCTGCGGNGARCAQEERLLTHSRCSTNRGMPRGGPRTTSQADPAPRGRSTSALSNSQGRPQHSVRLRMTTAWTRRLGWARIAASQRSWLAAQPCWAATAAKRGCWEKWRERMGNGWQGVHDLLVPAREELGEHGCGATHPLPFLPPEI